MCTAAEVSGAPRTRPTMPRIQGGGSNMCVSSPASTAAASPGGGSAGSPPRLRRNRPTFIRSTPVHPPAQSADTAGQIEDHWGQEGAGPCSVHNRCSMDGPKSSLRRNATAPQDAKPQDAPSKLSVEISTIVEAGCEARGGAPSRGRRSPACARRRARGRDRPRPRAQAPPRRRRPRPRLEPDRRLDYLAGDSTEDRLVVNRHHPDDGRAVTAPRSRCSIGVLPGRFGAWTSRRRHRPDLRPREKPSQ